MKKTKKLIALTLAVITLFSLFSVTSLSASAAEQKPEINKISCTDEGLKITWKKVPDAREYTVYRHYGEIDEWELAGTTDKNYYVDKNVVSGTEYSYVINTDEYDFGADKSFTYLSKPTLRTSSIPEGINLEWDTVEGASAYRVYRKNSKDEYKLIATVSELNYTDKSVQPGTTYCYSVRAVSQSGCKSKYADGVNEKAAIPLKAPKNVKVRNSPKGVRISWSKDASPEKYEIYRKSGKSSWVCAGTVSSSKSSFIDKKAPYGKKCSYKVRSVTQEQYSAFSSSKKLYALDPKKPAVALTFDDGPYTPVTNKILDSLKKNKSRATFFVVGSRVGTYKDCIKREASLGCEVGCHTYNHAILTRLGASEIKREISTSVKAIEKYSNQKVKLVRTPGGAVNDAVRRNVNYPLINWSVDTLDWQHRTTAKTVSKIKGSVTDGSIVLMHDLYEATGAAAVQIIPWLVKQGYQLVTVSELFELKGITPKKGNVYTHG